VELRPRVWRGMWLSGLLLCAIGWWELLGAADSRLFPVGGAPFCRRLAAEVDDGVVVDASASERSRRAV